MEIVKNGMYVDKLVQIIYFWWLHINSRTYMCWSWCHVFNSTCC